MAENKKIKKSSIVIILAVVTVIAVVGLSVGLISYRIKSSQNQCSDYVTQKFGTSDENLMKRDDVYGQCMRGKGLDAF